ncbi:SGNH/GDSL hydrolase family protein [Pontibacter akesuensis]|uniref:Lysophospholipase L1 n=1 Tax=Pontibacter akesuensis TaxID=388950 RepID=A0A1I7J2M9_9BACT|nr:SGNH/GDSL hydrolase family protein [Pontibacter akesuensis]GHA72767.1 lysophospholipase [Pontibacter akesuensis]SFU79407.1 Lysophospholipase L1 [Pontibacter akesuensis]
MNRLLLLILLFTAILTSCSDEEPTPDPSPSGHAYTYLALGDSYTIGEGVPASAQWGMQLAELLRAEGVDVANPVTIARTGWTTSDLASAVAAAKLKPEFDMVSLLIGVNNQYRGQSLATYRSELRQLLQTAIRLAKGDASNVLVLSIPDWGATPFARNQNREQIAAEIDAFNAVAREEAANAGVTFVNITPLTREAASDLSYVASDGLHYSGKMYREWALLALPEAKEILK